MTTRIVRLAAACAVAGSLVGGFDHGHVSAAGNQAPTVTGGSLTVHYEDVYTVHFTASDPEGSALTVVTPPVNEDWIGCDQGPATDFTCDYSSSRYYDAAPLPTAPFERTLSYSVTDGTSTSTGTWTITVLPPPTMEIVGRPTVTEGGTAVLQLKLSSNTYGSMLIPAHATAVDTADGNVISTADLMIDIADGQTSADVSIPVDDDAIDEPTEYFTVTVDAGDAIPYRFATGGNLVTVLDNDGPVSTDKTPPVVASHRNVIVERGGSKPAWVPFSPPNATDAVDGVLPAICNPAAMSAMPMGKTQVTCKATDAAGNSAKGTFQVTVRVPKTNGSAIAIGGDQRCVVAGQVAWVTAEGFTPGAEVTIQLQSASLAVVRLQSVQADRKGRIHQLVRIPDSATGDADVVVIGPSGNDDFVRMMPIRVARGRHHHGGPVMALLRGRACD
jgi:hypothetical protein